MKKPVFRISAKNKLNTKLEMEFGSVKEAKFFNPGLVDFEIIGPSIKKR